MSEEDGQQRQAKRRLHLFLFVFFSLTLAGTGWALVRSGISLSDLRAIHFLSMRSIVSIVIILIIHASPQQSQLHMVRDL